MKSITLMRSLTAACLLVGMSAMSQAAIVTLSPTDIHGNDTNTASFSNGDITLTPFIGAVQDTFNGNATRLGLDDAGTNNNAFNDPDIDPNNGNEERLEYAFSSTAGLSQLSYDFSRADGPGPDDGVVFTGFISNPQASFSVSDPNLFAVWDGPSATLRLNIPGALFSGAIVDVNFARPGASAGQTLSMSTTDTTQAGAQLAIRSISYETIPEPAALTLLCLGGLGLLGRRKR